MPDLHGLCTGKEHVVADQRFDSVVLLAFGKEHACLMVWLTLVHGLVDLIEGHPVPDLSFVTPEHRFTVPGKEIDQGSVTPGTIVLHQIQRRFVMRKRDHRFDPVAVQLVEHTVIESKPGLVRLQFIALRKDARPVDGHSEALEAHLGKQRDVLFVMVVKIHGFMARVVVALHDLCMNLARDAVACTFFHVGNAQALAIRLVGTFVLVGGGRTAPQELFWHLHKLENLLAGIEYLQGGFCAIFFKLIGTVLIFPFLFA